MKILRIKPQYQGLVITKNIFPIGMVTLDTNTVLSDHYIKYIDLGFQDIFETVDVCKCDKAEPCDKHFSKKYKNVKNEPKNEADTGSDE